MDSSSSLHESHKTREQIPEDIQAERAWLDLGLSLGSLTPLCKKQENENQICLELGVGGNTTKQRKVIELDHEDVRSGSDYLWAMSNNHDHNKLGLMLNDDHGHKNNYYHRGGVCLPSPSSSSISMAQWKIINHQDGCNDYLGRKFRTHQPGLWFTLCSSNNQRGESLPQIQKAFIRVKDENMTVFMIKRYLVRKLGLSNETEVEISCMGENLLHSQTLKQVRDAVWLPRLVESVTSSGVPMRTPNGPSVNHIMPLQYGKKVL